MTEIFENLLKNMNISKRKCIHTKTQTILYMIAKFMDPLKLLPGPRSKTNGPATGGKCPPVPAPITSN